MSVHYMDNLLILDGPPEGYGGPYRGTVNLRCEAGPILTTWGRLTFPVSVESHEEGVYHFSCPTCGEDLAMDVRGVRRDMAALTGELNAMARRQEWELD